MSPTSHAPFAVFASGRGSGFDAIVRAKRQGVLTSEIVALVCDQPGAPVIQKAKDAGIPALVIPAPKIDPAAILNFDEGDLEAARRHRRAIHDQQILGALKPHAPRYIVLSGYMRVLSPDFLEAFRSKDHFRVVNVHPSLLPAFPGVAAYRQAFESGSHYSGVTVHLVDEQLDHGPICAQEAFSIRDCASVAEVERRGLEIEHRLYPETLKWILSENFSVITTEGDDPTRGKRTSVRPH